MCRGGGKPSVLECMPVTIFLYFSNDRALASALYPVSIHGVFAQGHTVTALDLCSMNCSEEVVSSWWRKNWDHVFSLSYTI